jgi:M6 family metalloprotease-like protein
MRFLLSVLLVCSLSSRADYMDHFVNRDDVGIHKAPSLGKSKLVLIPIEVQGFPPINRDLLELFFGRDPKGFVAFYKTASLGRYQPEVTIAPTVKYAQCPLNATQFPGCKVARGDVNAFTAGMGMMRDTIKKAQELGFDFSAHDINGKKGVSDTWADGVMLITNVPFGGIAFPFGYFNREDNLNGGMGGPLIVNGIKISHIAIAGSNDVYVMVHEFGHLLGLTDLYDETQKYDGLYLSHMGAWHYDDKIPLPDAETRFRLRWSNWNQIQGRQRVKILPVETSGEVYRLGTGDEYFLIENRGPGTFDANLATRGLAIFHVDRKNLKGEEGAFVDRILSCVNCDAFHPLIRLVQADGKFEIEDNKVFRSADDLFLDGDSLRADDTKIPLSKTNRVNSTNFYSGLPSGFQVEDIKVNADGSIDVTLDAPSENQCGETLCTNGEACAPVLCGPKPVEKSGCASFPDVSMLAFVCAWILGLKKRADCQI